MDVSRLVGRAELLALRQHWRESGRIVIFTNGCFDLLHLGHVRYLEAARALGDVLIVGLNSDASVKRLKGPLRPLVNEQERAAVMSALRPVDYVTIFEEDTASNLIAALQPEIYVKGGDYTIGADETKPLPETPTVQNYGGEIVLIPFLPGHSTTNLIQKIVGLYSQPEYK